MMDLVSLGLALSIGQGPGSQPVGSPIPIPTPIVAPQIGQPALPVVQPLPRQIVPMPAVNSLPPREFIIADAPKQLPAEAKKDAAEPKKNGNGEEAKEEEKEEPEKGFFMKALEGTNLGSWMDERRISISGWTQGSYTYGLNNPVGTNGTITWNDRANTFLLQQHWIRIAKALDTESKCPSWGWQVDVLTGSDYRFTLPRGLWNSQLLNTRLDQNGVPAQNLYGVDIPQIYVNYYNPNWFEGTEFRVGRMYCQFGYESIEAPTTPLLSRSYAFNWAPPFTHWGAMIVPKFSKNWSAKLMAANGNDVMIGDPSEEWRFMGNIAWTSDDENDTVTLGTSIGRGKFNAGDPFAPATLSLMSENAGRNNINVFDLVWTHKFNDCVSYAFEGIYGYQYGVPTAAVVGFIPGAITGVLNRTHATANWASLVNYLTVKHNEKVTSVLRFETFDDFAGQRTGAEGLYISTTYGLVWKPNNWLQIRPEVRYDYATESQPFVGGTRHGLFVASTDFIVKW